MSYMIDQYFVCAHVVVKVCGPRWGLGWTRVLCVHVCLAVARQGPGNLRLLPALLRAWSQHRRAAMEAVRARCDFALGPSISALPIIETQKSQSVVQYCSAATGNVWWIQTVVRQVSFDGGSSYHRNAEVP